MSCGTAASLKRQAVGRALEVAIAIGAALVVVGALGARRRRRHRSRWACRARSSRRRPSVATSREKAAALERSSEGESGGVLADDRREAQRRPLLRLGPLGVDDEQRDGDDRRHRGDGVEADGEAVVEVAVVLERLEIVGCALWSNLCGCPFMSTNERRRLTSSARDCAARPKMAPAVSTASVDGHADPGAHAHLGRGAFIEQAWRRLRRGRRGTAAGGTGAGRALRHRRGVDGRRGRRQRRRSAAGWSTAAASWSRAASSTAAPDRAP